MLSAKMIEKLTAFDAGKLDEAATVDLFQQIANLNKQGALSPEHREAFDRLVSANAVRPLGEEDIAALNAGMALARKSKDPKYQINPSEDPSAAFDSTGVDGVDQILAMQRKLREAVAQATGGQITYQPTGE